MLFLNFNTKNRRADTAFVLYLFLLYVVFPISSMNNALFKPVFYPSLENGSMTCVLFPALEALLILFLVKKSISNKKI
jgi:hypothetical protein